MEDSMAMNRPVPTTSKGGGLLRIGLAVLVLGVLFVLGKEAGAYVPRFAAWVDGLGFWGPLVFMAGYATATVALVPGSLLTLAAGAIFGIGEGFLYVFFAASLGATVAFLVSRYFARSAIEQRLAGNEKFSAIDRAVGDEGMKIVFLLRLSPVFPFNLLNYGLGLTKVSLCKYVVAHLGMMPGTLLYVYYGKLVGDVAALAGGVHAERGGAYWTVLIVGLVATLVVTTMITRTARHALRRSAAF